MSRTRAPSSRPIPKVAASFAWRLSRDPRRLVAAARFALDLVRKEGPYALFRETAARLQRSAQTITYAEWVARYDSPTADELAALAARLAALRERPLFSVVMPTWESKEIWLRRAVESVRRQVYPDWELCIADDASRSPRVRRVLEQLAAEDPRIRVVFRAHNGHIAAASNDALRLARGEFVVLLDHDDELPPHALFQVAEEIDAHPDAGIVYSDEDRIDERGRRFGPYFKSDFSPDLFLSHNLISHLGVFRRSLVQELGGFREGFEGSQDYDLALRASEKLRPEQIRHVPAVLYHWRAIRGSAARAPTEKSYASPAALRAIEDHLRRRGTDAEVLPGLLPGLYRVRYALPQPPLVSIIIPTRDNLPLLRACLDSVRARTDAVPYQLIVVDNGSTDPQTLAYLERLPREGAAVLRYPGPFNFSAINNFAAAEAKGELLAFLNNDVEVLDSGWLRELASHAVRPEVGAASARLLYPDGRVQHAGVILGLGPDGIAGTPHRGFPRTAPGYCNRAIVIQNFSAVTAACMVMRRSVFEEVGGFDAVNLPVAYNDVDLCLRLREKGLRIVFTPYAELMHKESATRGSDLTAAEQQRFSSETFHMRRRWGALLANDPYFNPNLSLQSDAFLLADPPRQRPRFHPDRGVSC